MQAVDAGAHAGHTSSSVSSITVPTTAVESAAAAATAPAAAPSAPPAAEIMQLPCAATHDLVYCCRRCRRPLFAPHNLAGHDAGQHAFGYRRLAKERGHATAEDDDSGATAGGVGCTSFFLQDALQWMEDASSDVEGKLTCPKCHVRVGSLKWAGSQCSCGTWVTPALQIYKKGVDERYFPRGAVESSLQAAASDARGR